jgi:hypothetical protein
MKNTIDFRNPVRIQVEREGKTIHDFEIMNGVTDVGMDYLLGVSFDAVTAITSWYISLIDNVSYTALAAADTMSSHAGWIENVDFDEATRPEWAPAAPSSRSIANTTTVDFTINATVALRGVFITSVNTLSGTTGTLWATALFGSTLNLVTSDILKITYTVSG